MLYFLNMENFESSFTSQNKPYGKIFTLIQDTILKNITNENSVFVFPTDIDANTWAEQIITSTHIKAVATERFIAWDNFKGSSIKIRRQQFNAVPSLLRKIFAMQIIEKNRQAVKNEGKGLFTTIISPEFSETSDSFGSWIARLLPSLGNWKKKFDAADRSLDENSLEDGENQDFLTLYAQYSDFLEKNQLFEPSWEEIDFSTSNTKFILFFPEILEDFADYKNILENSENVEIISFIAKNAYAPSAQEALNELDNQNEHPPIISYTNARTELRKTALKIRELHEKQGIPWNKIAVNIPEIEIFKPYVERELSLYAIPFVMRAGSSLCTNSAGQIFTQIRDCYDSKFSYESVRSMLTDMYIPWKEKKLGESLVREGCLRKCLCSYKDSPESFMIDSWEKALQAGNTGNTTELELIFYKTLKADVKKFCTAKTFAEIQTAWFTFKSDFLDEKKFSEDANLILGHCLSFLAELTDIESSFEAHLQNPFAFFVSELEEKTYQKQHKTEGVSIFNYKVAAVSAFDVNFVLNASQKALTVPGRILSFLSKEKRRALGIQETDYASTAFIRLYAKNTAFFSSAEQSFSGFTIPHSYFLTDKKKNEAAEAEHSIEDFVLNEKLFLNGDGKFPEKITERQKKAFEHWAKTSLAQPEQYHVNEPVKKAVDSVLKEGRSKYSRTASAADKIHITYSDMSKFFPCPRKWLYSSILELKEDSLDSQLFSPFDYGNILHKILELFMKNFKGKKLPYTDIDGIFQDEEAILQLVIKCTQKAFTETDRNIRGSPSAMKVINSKGKAYSAMIMDALHKFCMPPEKTEGESFGGFTVFDAEKWLECRAGENESGDENSESFYFSGKVDCILSSDNGDVAIIDYKSSSGSIPDNKVSIVPPDFSAPEKFPMENFQMPVYVTLWNKNYARTKVSKVSFFSIKDKTFSQVLNENAADSASFSSGISPEKYENTLKWFHSFAKAFAEKTEKLDFLPGKDLNPFKECTKCDFISICRKTFEISGDN